METPTTFNAWFNGERIGKYNTLPEAKKAITTHPKYKKTLFTGKGDASSKNPNQMDCFRIYDNNGAGWYIR